jgi:hypothetical protein
LATFLFSLSYGLLAVLYKQLTEPVGKEQVLLLSAAAIPVIFLLSAILLSCYFQRLTYACRIYMEGIERLPEGMSPPLPSTDPQDTITDDDLKQVRINLDILIKAKRLLRNRDTARRPRALLKAIGKGDK